MSADMLTAAVGYAARRWLVFPLHHPTPTGCSCSKGADCGQAGKHPRTQHGLNDATTDPRQVREWWSKWPQANIGIRTGIESGLLVIDVDNKGCKRGSESLAVLVASHGGLPPTLTATTGSGEHLLFKHPGIAITNSAGMLAEGVDIRADGGYIVAAPSLHKNGKRYAWVNTAVPVADGPAWLLQQLKLGTKGRAEMPDTEQDQHTTEPTITEGTRNDTLYKTGCALRGQMGKDRGEIVTLLLAYNTANCEPPLEAKEVLRIVDSVCTHPAELGSPKSGRRQQDNPLYWFQFNTREWFADQNLNIMSDVQTGWYIRLKAFAWDDGGFLPADYSKLYKLAKARSQKAFERDCGIVLAEYEEVMIDGELRLRHPKMATAFSKTLELWMQKKQAGEASRMARLSNSVLRIEPPPNIQRPTPMVQ
jgi:hypothetical protein